MNLLEQFEKDTLALGQCTDDFLKSFYPVYHLLPDALAKVQMEQTENILRQFVFYRITSCTICNVENRFAYFAEKMQKFFTVAYAMRRAICYGIVSCGGKTSLVLGLQHNTTAASCDEMKAVVQGIFPGIAIEAYDEPLLSMMSKGTASTRHVGCISGIPALKIDGAYQEKDLSVLMRTLNGQNYTVLTLCRPIDILQINEKLNQAIHIQDQSFAISKRTISMQRGFSEGNTHTDSYNETDSEGTTVGMSAAPLFALIGAVAGGPPGAIVGGLIGLVSGINVSANTGHQESIGYSDAVSQTITDNKGVSADIQNGFALELMKMAETQIERLKIGRSIGMWQTLVSFSSDSEFSAQILKGYLYSEMAAGLPEVLPPVSFLHSVPIEQTAHGVQMMIPANFFSAAEGDAFSSMLTSEELCGICTVPSEHTVGFEIQESKGYALNYIGGDEERRLGLVCEYDRPIDNVPFSLDDEALNRHTFVCGLTGSGKTNTVKKILAMTKKTFLVIEPAKTEYRNIQIEGKLEIYTPGRPELNSLRMNPFYIMPGVSPQQHIDALKDLFSASFGFYGPMSYIFEKCLHNIYKNRGWNLVFGFHPYFGDGRRIDGLFEESSLCESYTKTAHRFLFPTMQDLKEEIDRCLEEDLEYRGELQGNIKSALKARLESLCVGAKGYLFNTGAFPEMEKLLRGNVVVELDGLADDADKAFSLGLLIIYVNEFRKIQKELNGRTGLQHLLVIEEAHRLLKNVTAEIDKEVGNAKGKAVEHFTNMLAEMRSYGQGVIVAEQIPTKIAPDVIKNSSNKIIHRLVAKDDQEAVANTIGVSLEDAIYLGNSTKGYALCHKEGMVQPVIVKFDEVSDNNVLDISLFEREREKKIADINSTMIMESLHKELCDCSKRVLLSLMYCDDADRLFEGFDAVRQDLKSRLTEKTVTLIPTNDLDEHIAKCICDGIGGLLLHSEFSARKIPENALIDAVRDIIVGVPTSEKLDLVKKLLSEFYNQDVRSVAVAMAAKQYAQDKAGGKELESCVPDYLIVSEENFFKDVTCAYERRYRDGIVGNGRCTC